MLKILVPSTIAIFTMSYEQTSDAAQKAADSELAQRLAQAEAVISGEVVSVARLAPQRPGIRSEHDPDWWQAMVQVESVEKGDVSTKTISVLFANSRDIAWYKSPKLKQGDRGIWLLHNRDISGRPVPGLAVTDSLDSQPPSELARIRLLLQKSTKK
jgi:hypothetical protein